MRVIIDLLSFDDLCTRKITGTKVINYYALGGEPGYEATATIILDIAECSLSGTERLQIVLFSDVKNVLDAC